MNALNNILFIALPYTALALLLVGSIYRYRARGFTYSSLSAQFLEGGRSYLPMMLFHWGILIVFLAHLLSFLVPGAMLALLGQPARLLAIEIALLSLGLAALAGLFHLFVRRLTQPRLAVVTSRMDRVIELLLLAQIALGIWTALGYRWGYYWFAADLSPYLWSILTLSPRIEAVSAMALPIKLHVAGAFVILALIPFTRLAHFLVAPLHYTWRGYQQVMWYWDRKRVRDPASAWSTTPPRNN